jgi:hypothetical protein
VPVVEIDCRSVVVEAATSEVVVVVAAADGERVAAHAPVPPATTSTPTPPITSHFLRGSDKDTAGLSRGYARKPGRRHSIDRSGGRTIH